MTPSSTPAPMTPSQSPREGGRQSQSAPCLSQKPPPSPHRRDRGSLPFGRSTTDPDNDPDPAIHPSTSTQDVILPGSWLLRNAEPGHGETDGGAPPAAVPLHLRHPPPPPRSVPPPPTQSVRVLIVGDRGAGKSSLARRFVRGTFDPRRPPRPTRGVEYSRKDVALTVPSAGSESGDGETNPRDWGGGGVDVECVRVQLWELPGDDDDDAGAGAYDDGEDSSSFASSSFGTATAVSRVLEAGGMGRDYFSAAVIVCDVAAATSSDGGMAILSEGVRGYVRQVREAVDVDVDGDDPRSFPTVLLLNKMDAVRGESTDPCHMLHFARDLERLCQGLGIAEWFPTSTTTCAGLHDGFHLLIRSVLLHRRRWVESEEREESPRSRTEAGAGAEAATEGGEPEPRKKGIGSASSLASAVAYSRMIHDARGNGPARNGGGVSSPPCAWYKSCSVS